MAHTRPLTLRFFRRYRKRPWRGAWLGFPLSRSLWLGCALLISACHSIQPVARPEIPRSATWQTAAAAAATQPIESRWWEGFHSPQLNRLIADAVAQSPDLRMASQGVRQAELQMNSAGASLFPSLHGGAASGSSGNREGGGDWQTSDSSRAFLGVSYEVDLWGRVSASIASAEAVFRANQYDYAAARLSLAGAVASAWFQWLALQEHGNTAQENIAIAERIYRIVDARYRNGVASAADLARQRTNVLTQSAALLPLQLQARQTRAALALLIGRLPQGFTLREESLRDLDLPIIAAGVPVDIITRRPDIASAEAQLQAADANVSAARSALLPDVQLGGSASRSASELFRLSNPVDAVGWSLSLAQVLFDGGRLRNQIKLTESRRVALVEQYRKTIYTALQEVDDALDRTEVSRQQEQSQIEIVAQAKRSLQLTEVRYREGSDDLLTLLDAQRSLFQAQDQLTRQRQQRLDAAVALYKALGGGWSQY